MRKCLDRIFRKVVAKIENKKIDVSHAEMQQQITHIEPQSHNENTAHVAHTPTFEPSVEAGITTPAIFKHEHPQKVHREYQINSKNLEKFLDMPSTDDHYYTDINKQLPMGSSNGLAYVDEGYGTVLKI